METTTAWPRLRQVALVARDLAGARRLLEAGLGVRDPFADPGVAEFGLANAVYEAGFDFVEVVSPADAGTAAGRHLDRTGDGGYMAIFQLERLGDLAAVRRSLASLGVRAVWETDLGDIASSHLHPRDVPGAIVSVDAARVPESWRWAGPRWILGPPADAHFSGGIVSVTVSVDDPAAAAARWSSVLGCGLDPLPSGQFVGFVPGGAGIVEVVLDLGRSGSVTLGSVTVRSR